MSDYYLGLDNGGTMVKAVIFDEKGRFVSGSSEKLKMIVPRPGFTERDMDELWQANCRVIKRAVEQAGPSVARNIRSAACSGHGKGLYLWGSDDRPAYNGIVSTDSRAVEYARKWTEGETGRYVQSVNFQKILASQPVSILRWFANHEPEVLNKTKWIFECKDYIRYRLTGEAYAEISDYSGSNLMNLTTMSFDRELLNKFELGDMIDKLPPLKRSTDICGFITEETAAMTGLPVGVPVAGGMFDIDACAVAMNIFGAEQFCVIAGTWSINGYVSKEPVKDGSVMMNSCYAEPGYFFIEEGSPTSAGNHEWFTGFFLDREKLQAEQEGISIYKYTDKLASAISPAEQGLIFLPFIYGSNYNPLAKACFLGFDSHHSRAHMIRAVLECIVFGHKVHLEKLLRHQTPEVIRLAGGAANSELWAQMFADILKIPVEILDSKELGALGCAMAAAVATGKYADLPAAGQAMVRVKKRFEPNDALADIYDEKYARYVRIADKLEDIWQ